MEDSSLRLGSFGYTTVRHAFRGKHIAVNLVNIGTKHLKDMGLNHMYGYGGYKICVYYMMVKKSLAQGPVPSAAELFGLFALEGDFPLKKNVPSKRCGSKSGVSLEMILTAMAGMERKGKPDLIPAEEP